ncbi:hypothetical protein ACFYWD_20980 [Streptomyces sp. NPDC003781]
MTAVTAADWWEESPAEACFTRRGAQTIADRKNAEHATKENR